MPFKKHNPGCPCCTECRIIDGNMSSVGMPGWDTSGGTWQAGIIGSGTLLHETTMPADRKYVLHIRFEPDTYFEDNDYVEAIVEDDGDDVRVRATLTQEGDNVRVTITIDGGVSDFIDTDTTFGYLQAVEIDVCCSFGIAASVSVIYGEGSLITETVYTATTRAANEDVIQVGAYLPETQDITEFWVDYHVSDKEGCAECPKDCDSCSGDIPEILQIVIVMNCPPVEESPYSCKPCDGTYLLEYSSECKWEYQSATDELVNASFEVVYDDNDDRLEFSFLITCGGPFPINYCFLSASIDEELPLDCKSWDNKILDFGHFGNSGGSCYERTMTLTAL